MFDLKNKILDISHNYYEYLLSFQNVIGIGCGHKHVNNINTLEPCIHVLVENKVNYRTLTKNNIIPKTYMGIKTDVIQVGKINLEISNEFTKKLRHLEGGGNIGPAGINSYGTICCIAKKNMKINDEDIVIYYILSNNHVLADYNRYPIGSAFLQPSARFNGKYPNDAIAGLETFIEIKFIEANNKYINYVDCAIARIANPQIISNKILGIGAIKGISKPKVDMNIRKSGVTTGLTSGYITSLGISIKVDVTSLKKEAFFKDQLLIQVETKPGDSGSAIINKNNEIVGMHMGSGGDGYSLSNDINLVLEKLNVEVYTGV